MRTAVLDLGTNTFNLVVAEKLNGKIEFILKDKIPVKLGSNGFKNKMITPEAMERGLNGIAMLVNEAQSAGAEQIYAFATSALRGAKNATDFISQIKSDFGIDIEIISGDKEAELIYYGVKHANILGDEKVLIMDIGGGSTEYIIADKSGPIWMKSYDIGAARLLDMFNPEDPIDGATKQKILTFLQEETEELHRKIKEHKISMLIGSSGSFDSVVDMIAADEKRPYPVEKVSSEIKLADLERILAEMVTASVAQRHARNGLISMRVDFIVMSCLLIQSLLQNHAFQKVLQCGYSLKEGAVFKTFSQQ
ncbi:MAG: hypothetical protein ACPF8V_02430 [Luteibaculum sp.]